MRAGTQDCVPALFFGKPQPSSPGVVHARPVDQYKQRNPLPLGEENEQPLPDQCGVWQLGKKVLAMNLAVWPRVTLAHGLKYVPGHVSTWPVQGLIVTSSQV